LGAGSGEDGADDGLAEAADFLRVGNVGVVGELVVFGGCLEELWRGKDAGEKRTKSPRMPSLIPPDV
jgi:hypothetical protein